MIPIRMNVTCEGVLLALSESGAEVRLPTPQKPDKQTTLAIEAEGETLYLPARVVSSLPQPNVPRSAYRVAVEFLALQGRTAAALRQLIGHN